MLPGAQLSPPSPHTLSRFRRGGAQAHDRGVGTHTLGRECLFDDCFCLCDMFFHTCRVSVHSSGAGGWVLERTDSAQTPLATRVWSTVCFDLLVDGSAVGRMIGSTGLIASFSNLSYK